MEDYINESISKKRPDINTYKFRLKKLRYENEIIEHIIDDLNNEVDKEEFARLSAGNTYKLIIGGAVLAIILMIITILSALGILFKGTMISTFFFGAIASALIAVLKGFDELRARKSRRDVRKIFWKDKY